MVAGEEAWAGGGGGAELELHCRIHHFVVVVGIRSDPSACIRSSHQSSRGDSGKGIM